MRSVNTLMPPLMSLQDTRHFRGLLLRSLRHAVGRTRNRRLPASLHSMLSLLDAQLPALWRVAQTLEQSLRLVDRAWRSMPSQAALLAPIYARLLTCDAMHAAAAWQLLRRADEDCCDPDVAALLAWSLLNQGREDEARRTLLRAAGQYFLDSRGLLAWMVAYLARSPTTDRALCVDSMDRRMDTAPGPLDFRVTGRAWQQGNHIRGWARVGWTPDRRVRVRFTDEHQHVHEVHTSRPMPAYQWQFDVLMAKAGLTGTCVYISVRCPDGQWQSLPDAPLLLERATLLRPLTRLPAAWADRSRASASRTRRQRCVPSAPHVAAPYVVIPVYADHDMSLACIESVLATVAQEVRVLVIDDATPEPRLAAALDALAANGRIHLLRHAVNRGFVAAANAGMAMWPERDAVLLNADTRVFGDWLLRLQRTAYQATRIGTVTPFSNSGSIASYPGFPGGGEDDIDVDAARQLDEQFKSVHRGRHRPLPVGVGFCLYIKRACWRQTGLFDAAVFGRGYGEEVDFCLRARALGWRHHLAADVLVYHAGGRSFGAARSALLERSQHLIERRHRGFARFIASFVARDPLHAWRREIDQQRLVQAGRRYVLMVTLAWPGGVDRFVADRCRALPAQGLTPLILRPHAPHTAGAAASRHCQLWTDGLSVPNLVYAPAELPALMTLLRRLDIVAIELQHFLHLDARLIESLRQLSRYDVFIHDYAWICPRITLFHRGRYCGEPELDRCERCAARGVTPIAETIGVAALRARSLRWLQGARRIIAPSQDTARRMQRYFPQLDIEVQPHTIMSAAPSLPWPAGHPHGRPPGRDDTRIKVGLIGAIGTHKGYRVLMNCANDARARDLPLEFVVIGYSHDDAALQRTGRVFVTGRYTEDEVPYLLQREAPSALFVASIWPETWCYALDHAFASGLPLLAFDIGAVAERLRAAGQGELIAPGTPASRINAMLLRLARSRPAASFSSDVRMNQHYVVT